MFYVIAASHPTREEAGELVGDIRRNTPLLSSDTRKDRSEIFELEINKKDFKIGSLDQLMVLNETAMKLDNQLENVCKKIEKVAFETMQDQSQELQYIPRENVDQNPKKPKASKLMNTKALNVTVTLI